ncbi:MAG: tetratricopeptide repeat protein [Candidatus Kariarchaeaceae archaeon]
MELEKGTNISKSEELLDKSLEIYKSIGDRQGTAWIRAWQGQIFLRKGDLNKAKNKFTQAKELFESIKALQGLNLVNSLKGLMFYQQGEQKQAEEILEQAFNSSIVIGNPVVLSYCFLPLIELYIESGNRSKAQKSINDFQEFSKNTNNANVKLHESVAEAIFLKSSSRFIDKGQAQKKFLEILDEIQSARADSGQLFFFLPTLDKSFSSFVVFHLVELYLEEFKLTEDRTILLEAKQLIDNQIQNIHDQKFSPELAELSLLKVKFLIIEGEIEKAVLILEQVKQDANTNKFHRLEEKVGIEIEQIDKEFKKWDTAFPIKDRIKKVELEEYIRKAQKFLDFRSR